MKRHLTNDKGFTLIETCIAMVVMMVVGLGATSLFLYAIRNNSGGTDRALALALAQERLEDLRSVEFDDPMLNVGTVTTREIVQATSPNAGQSPDGGGLGGYSASSVGGYTTSKKPSPNPNPTPTPAATPTPGGGGGGGAGGGGGSRAYDVETDVDAIPAGSATPTQKRVTITVRPANGAGANSWMNVNPVVVVIHRSSNATGPYRTSN
ncbi:MAG TPA: prepilin-type N-terminal cleavage/methylation domain-containing protein [Pyrinomonadaceae bacterium]|nr:prepilin-type N-terminal cleavage/methylation domain-containing protein [Pyrinomonadaceae bacterium]